MEVGDTVLSRFVVEARAGEGGMGVVFRARDLTTAGHVALKVIPIGSLESLDRFTREAGVLAVLRHPGIVRYVAHGSTPEGEAWLAMDWLEGEELSKRLAREALTVSEGIRLARRIADALAVAHGQGVIHRDLKPSNIFLRGGSVDDAVLIDFGVARLEEAHAELTLTGTIIGTPGYMAPEQARGTGRVDARADIFSLGSVIFRSLGGHPPFAAESVVAQLAKILFSEAPRLRERRPDVPPQLDDLVARMLAKDPSARPPSATALATELEEMRDLGAADTWREPVSGGAPVITAGEQRLVSVVLAAGEWPTTGYEATVKDRFDALDSKPQRLREAALELGAEVEVLTDGTVIATLLGRGAATDQATQAARCALAMLARAPEASIALSTTHGELDGGMLRTGVGDVIDRAAALLQEERGARRSSKPSVDTLDQPPPGVLVDDVTAALLDARFELRRVTSGAVVLGERGGPDVARTLLGRQTACVGRERELAFLDALFEEVASESVARCVLVTGVPGVGKSRLRYEFVRALGQRDPDARVWIGRGDPMSAGAPFAILAQALRAGLELTPGLSLEQARHELTSRVARRVPSADVDRVASFLGELVDVRFDDDTSVQLRAARQNPMLMGDQLRRAFEDFVSAECESATVVVVLEDLHWGDVPTVTFIDAALRNFADAKLMVLALARPEIQDVFPKLFAERGLQEVRLGELTRRAAESLIRGALGDDASDEDVKSMLERAGGNAFFLEEVIRSFADGRKGGLPDTVLAMLQARLETLPTEARRLLRAASIFGEAFWTGGLSVLAGRTEVDAWLGTLSARELVSRRPKSRFQGEEEYVFRHALVREAAYSTLLGEDCILGHRLAGDWLARVGETSFATIAEHYERGGKPVRARRWYARAAVQALEGNDLLATLRMVERATRAGIGADAGSTGSFPAAQGSEPTTRSRRMSAPPPAPMAADELGQLRLLAAEAHAWRGEFAEARAAGLEAMELLEEGSERWCAAAGEVALATSRLGDYGLLARILEKLRALGATGHAGVPYIVATARAAQHLIGAGEAALVDELLEHLDEVANRIGATEHVAQAWIAFVRCLRSDPAASMELTELAIFHFEKAGDRRMACMARGNLGDVNNQMGRYAEAEGLLRDALASAERMSLTNVATLVRLNLGFCVGRLGRADEALAILERAATQAKSQRDLRREACAWIYAATILLEAGRAEDAAQSIARALPNVGSAPPMRAWALGVDSAIQRVRGDTRGALDSAREAVEILGQVGFLDEGEATVRLAWSEALRTAGEHDAYRRALAEAVASLERRASAVADDGRRASFLTNVPEHARTMALARAYRSTPPDG